MTTLTTSTATRGSDTWFRAFAPAPDAPVRLVCLPHAGGSATFYAPVARALSGPIDVLAAQYPGRQDRRHEPCLTSIEALADAVTAAVLPWCDRPVALFGHSMGASLGYEVARRLEARSDVELVRLFASGRRAPSVSADDGVRHLDDDGMIAELRSLAGTAASVLGDEEIMRMSMPAIRADYAAAEVYVDRAGERLHSPITVLTGDADPRTSLDNARLWSAHTTGAADLHVFSGGHFFLTDHSVAVLDLVRDRLALTR